MKNKFIIPAVLLFIVFAAAAWLVINRPAKPKEEKVEVNNSLTVTSQAFENGKTIPSKYTCDSENVNPPINIVGVTNNVKSLVLIMEDPDSPGKVWNHWLIWNINPASINIPENNVPSGAVQGKNDFGQNKYGGPCPFMGTHRYFFKVYALDTTLNLTEGASRSELDQAISSHIIATGELMGTYKKL